MPTNHNPPDPGGMEGPDLTRAGLYQAARRMLAAGPHAPEEWAEVEELARAIDESRRGQSRPWPVARAIPEIDDQLPHALLAAQGLGGAVLSVGEVCILTGAGGVGKSLLASGTALGVAMAQTSGREPLPGRIFEGQGGPVLIAAYEDRPAVITLRLQQLADAWKQRAAAGHLGKYTADDVLRGLKRVFVIDMRGWPMYGPPPDDPMARQSVQLEGLTVLKHAAKECEARLVIVDPALSAFTGESNAAAPVRVFLAELGLLAERNKAGIMLTAHSTKIARAVGNPYDPGQTGGSGAWTDGCRGVLTLTTQQTDTESYPLLAISKANWGASYRALPLHEITYETSAGRFVPIGYEAAATAWSTGTPTPGTTPSQEMSENGSPATPPIHIGTLT